MILEDIVEKKREEIEKLKSVESSLAEELKRGKISLIAEIKKASPSAGVIEENFSPLGRLKNYEKGGAGAISVLTDEKFFAGSPRILNEVSSHTNLPVLRKDFILDEIQIYESLILGADCILLIGEILNQKKLAELLDLAYEYNLEALVEVHSRETLLKVLETSARMIGINNRNLEDFSVNLETTGMILNELEKKSSRKDYLVVSESGISSREDIDRLRALGVDGVLIGEALMKAGDPERKIRKLFAGSTFKEEE